VIDDNLIQQITARIVEQFNPRRVVLFGSRARGEADGRAMVAAAEKVRAAVLELL
jgi:hypothetical protein